MKMLADGDHVLFVITPPGGVVRDIKVRVHRAKLSELARCLDCCPGAKMDTRHALWHYNHPDMQRPCPLPEHYKWH